MRDFSIFIYIIDFFVTTQLIFQQLNCDSVFSVSVIRGVRGSDVYDRFEKYRYIAMNKQLEKTIATLPKCCCHFYLNSSWRFKTLTKWSTFKDLTLKDLGQKQTQTDTDVNVYKKL